MQPLEVADSTLALERTRRAMGHVLLALIPGVLALFWLQGWGTLTNLVLAASSSMACEAVFVRLRGQQVTAALSDGSALVSATLLAIALPPAAPWWLVIIASTAALGLGKHIYGGVGRNPFNPAMVGYALVLVSFPVHMTHWPALHAADLQGNLQQAFGLHLANSPDAWAHATALDALRLNKSLTMDELFAHHPAFGRYGGQGVEWSNLGFLLGGLFLLHRRVISWHAPVGMLVSLFVFSLVFWNGSGSDSQGSPLFHLLSGATMLGAFFIVTEPVSGPRSAQARLIFGIGAGALVYVIRTWGNYPDGVAFAVLLMNLAVPALERVAKRTPQVSQ